MGQARPFGHAFGLALSGPHPLPRVTTVMPTRGSFLVFRSPGFDGGRYRRAHLRGLPGLSLYLRSGLNVRMRFFAFNRCLWRCSLDHIPMRDPRPFRLFACPDSISHRGEALQGRYRIRPATSFQRKDRGVQYHDTGFSYFHCAKPWRPRPDECPVCAVGTDRGDIPR